MTTSMVRTRLVPLLFTHEQESVIIFIFMFPGNSLHKVEVINKDGTTEVLPDFVLEVVDLPLF